MADLSKILINHYLYALGNHSENIDFATYSGDMSRWYVRIRGLDGEEDSLRKGQYILTFDTTKTMGPLKMAYPNEPPTFEVKTPNGLFGTGGKVCVNIGEYHSQNYKQNLGIAGFTEFLIQGLVAHNETGGGIRIEVSTVNEIRKMAQDSREFNKKNFKQINNKLDVVKIMSLASGLWNESADNSDRLERGKEKDIDRKNLAKKIHAWSYEYDEKIEITKEYIAEMLIKYKIVEPANTTSEANIDKLDDKVREIINRHL